MYDINQNEVNVNSITEVTNDWIDVCYINVENVDTLFAAGIASHNAGGGGTTKYYLTKSSS